MITGKKDMRPGFQPSELIERPGYFNFEVILYRE